MANDWNDVNTGGYREPGGAPPPPGGYNRQPGYGTGLPDNVAGALAYVTFIPALIFLLVEPYKSRPFVRFHSFQSLALCIVSVLLNLLHIIPVLGTLVAFVGGIVLFVVWIIALVQALQGKMWRIPLIADLAAMLGR